MRPVDKMLLRLRSLLRRGRVEDELDRELRFHLEQQVEENLAKGMDADRARREAHRSVGPVALWKDACRDTRAVGWIEGLLQDARYAVRALARSPGFSLGALATLSLGIGATTVVFSIVDSVLLHPVPFRDPDRLVEIYRWGPRGGGPMQPAAMLETWRDQTQVFEQVEAHWEGSFLSLGGPEAEVLFASQVTEGMFRFLGVSPEIGRGFAPGDSMSPVAVLSHDLWLRRFGGDPDALGQQLDLDDEAYTVIGVMPAWFRFPIGNAIQVWLPFDPARPNPLSPRGAVTPIARIRAGLPLADADRQVSSLAPDLDSTLQGTENTARLQPLRRLSAGAINIGAYYVQRPRAALFLIFGASGLVLAAACANTASLLLSRGLSRSRETALRAALGSSRLRLARPVLVETLLLAALSCALGLSMAAAAIPALAAVLPPDLVELSLNPLDLDLRAAIWAVSASVAVALIAAAAPMALFAGRGLTPSLVEDALPVPGRSRLRALLVSTETAVALVLLIAAGLMARSLWRLTHVETGFTAEGVVVVEPVFRGARYRDTGSRMDVMADLLEWVQLRPGVSSAALADALPLRTFVITFGEVETDTGSVSGAGIAVHGISGDYFQTLDIPLIRGRVFEGDAARPDLAIISRGLADRLWPGADPIGRRFRLEGGPLEEWSTVIGVVGDVRTESPLEPREDWVEVYRPVPTDPASWGIPYLIVKTDGKEDTIRSVGEAVRQIDPELPVGIRAMTSILRDTLVTPRFQGMLLAGFALLTLLLASMGVYAVVAYETGRRTREIGIRIALGATRSQLVRDVLTRSLLTAALGAAVGAAAALALTRLMSSMLYEVGPADPVSYFAGPLVLVSVVGLAGYLPARRASRGDPMTALRHD